MRKYVASVAVATAVVAGMALVSFAPAANATVYNYDFTATDGLLTATGAVTVIPNGPNLQVTDINGVVQGTGALAFVGTQTISSLQPNPAFPNVSTSPDGAWFFDNLAFNGDPHLDNAGVVFYTGAPGSWNLFSNGPGNYALWEWNPSGGYVVQESGTFTASETPLPSTWTMLIAGFVGLGFFAHRSAKKNSVALATA